MDALMIGVSGMRGIVGTSLTPATIMRMSAALAAYLKENEKPANGTHFRIVFGRDSRPSGSWVFQAASSMLTACGVEVIDLGIVSTPGVAMMVGWQKADAGVVATASHNPIQWNGLKFLTRNQVAPPPEVAAKIREYYDAEATPLVDVHQQHPLTTDSQTHALHLKQVLKYVDVNGISGQRYKVVVDSVNGAGCVSVATLLSKLGCQTVHLNNTPDGKFPHEPEPTADNLKDLSDQVVRHKADVGFAQDPDADRLAIVDENGRYIGEEYTVVLAAKWMLSKHKGVAVANLSSSRMLDDVAAAAGGTVLRSPVGEANVIKVMQDNGAVIGGEGNGGVIDPRIVPGRDSLVGIAYTLQLMQSTGKRLSELVDEIPRYCILKTKFECPRDKIERAVAALKEHFASEKLDLQDGIRIDFADGWVHARASNTEPIMRIIAEAPTEAAARAYVDKAQKVVDAIG